MAQKRYTQADWDGAAVWWTIHWDGQLVPLRVFRESPKTVLVLDPAWGGSGYMGTRRDKGRTYLSSPVYPTWEDARSALIERLEKGIVAWTQNIARDRAQLEALLAMTEPPDSSLQQRSAE